MNSLLKVLSISWSMSSQCTFSLPPENILQSETLLKLKFLQECFSRFLNCTNGTKSGKASHEIFVFLLWLTYFTSIFNFKPRGNIRKYEYLYLAGRNQNLVKHLRWSMSRSKISKSYEKQRLTCKMAWIWNLTNFIPMFLLF